jgi:hypothetical protein
VGKGLSPRLAAVVVVDGSEVDGFEKLDEALWNFSSNLKAKD